MSTGFHQLSCYLPDAVCHGMLVAAIGFLVTGEIEIVRILRRLPPGGTRRAWHALGAIVACFVIGYVGFAVHHGHDQGNSPEHFVVLVFFLGAIFVLGSVRLFGHTIKVVAHYRNDSLTDGLMGIHNRRYFDARLDEECAHTERHGSPLSLLLIDLDKFKLVNDVHGHRAGDGVLRDLGHLLRREVRRSDVVARYGGEEIAILAPDTGLQGARMLAERIRAEVCRHDFSRYANGREPLSCTVSVGVSTTVGGAANEAAVLVERADAALYRAKETGRNRTVCAGVPTETASWISAAASLHQQTLN
jgi:diguanylate cyclase (GGDEF)-like protein